MLVRSIGRFSLLRVTTRIEQIALFSSSRYLSNDNKPVGIENDILKDIGSISLDKIKINRDLSQSTQAKRGKQFEKDEKDDNFFNFATWKGAVGITLFSGIGYYFIKKEKNRLEIEKEAESNRTVVGGSFELKDMNGNKFTEKDLLGHFSIIYFGFTHCPDVCPAELDKLDGWLKILEKKRKEKIQPIFITCDPIRDSPDVLKEYLKDFHPNLIGLTGTYDQVKEMCKNYKVFFSTPRNANSKKDYIVDHSTFFYLLDPEGKFIDALGDIYDEKEGIEKIEAQISAYLPQCEREKRMNSWYSFLFK